MIALALGANLRGPAGTPLQTLQAVPAILKKAGIQLQAASRVWLTAPVPASDQPDYHNAVILIETARRPKELLAALQNIEAGFGRIRLHRNEARVLDLDLLFYHGELSDQPELILPHPRLHQRAFVLLPLQEVAPDWRHPRSGATVGDMLAALPPVQSARPLVEKWA